MLRSYCFGVCSAYSTCKLYLVVHIFLSLNLDGRDILSFVAPSKSPLVTLPPEPSDWPILLFTLYSSVSVSLSARRFITKRPAKMSSGKVITCAPVPMLQMDLGGRELLHLIGRSYVYRCTVYSWVWGTRGHSSEKNWCVSWTVSCCQPDWVFIANYGVDVVCGMDDQLLCL